MKQYRFNVSVEKRDTQQTMKLSDTVELITPYVPYKLFEKWMTSDIRVTLMEQFLRKIVGEDPTLEDIRGTLFAFMYKQEVFRSSAYRDAYFEIKQLLKYASNTIDIDVDEAMLIIESGLVDVKYKDRCLDLTTILNEREVYGGSSR